MPGEKRTRFYRSDINKALVTIVTPYYRSEASFGKFFNSVMNQTFPWFEWKIINYSKEQADSELLEKHAKGEGRIEIINLPGRKFDRHACMTYSNTGLVVLLTTGRLIAPQYLEYLYWALYYNVEIALAYTDSVQIKDNEQITNHKVLIERESGLPNAAMIRREVYEKAGVNKAIHVPLEMIWHQEDGVVARVVDTKKFIDKYEDYSFYRTKYVEWKELSDQKESERRVLWLVPQMVMGGADKFNLDAIAGLNKLDYKNYVLTTMHTDHVWRKRFEQCTDEVYCMAEFLNPVHFMEYVSYFIQSRQIDIVVLTNSYAGYYMLPWIRAHFPKLVIVDYLHLEEWYWRNGGYARTSAAMHGVTEKTYVCNSSTRKVLIDEFGCDPKAVDCMYIGVDHQYFDQKKENAGYLHARLNIASERPIVLFPCRISEQKRPFMVIDIALGVIRTIPDAAFVVVGDGPQLSELQQAIRKKRLQKHIYCNGASDNMRACYRDADIVLICSINEGLALTAYEACSMGVPVISSDVGGQRDLIGDDVGALIPMRQAATDIDNRNFPREEVDEYVDKIVHILGDTDYAEKLGNAARKKIESGFSIEFMVKQLDKELQMLCNDKTREQKRRQLSDAFRMMPHMATDYYTMYLEWEKGLRNHGMMALMYILYDTLLKVPVIKIPVRVAGKLIYRKMAK